MWVGFAVWRQSANSVIEQPRGRRRGSPVTSMIGLCRRCDVKDDKLGYNQQRLESGEVDDDDAYEESTSRRVHNVSFRASGERPPTVSLSFTYFLSLGNSRFVSSCRQHFPFPVLHQVIVAALHCSTVGSMLFRHRVLQTCTQQYRAHLWFRTMVTTKRLCVKSIHCLANGQPRMHVNSTHCRTGLLTGPYGAASAYYFPQPISPSPLHEGLPHNTLSTLPSCIQVCSRTHLDLYLGNAPLRCIAQRLRSLLLISGSFATASAYANVTLSTIRRISEPWSAAKRSFTSNLLQCRPFPACLNAERRSLTCTTSRCGGASRCFCIYLLKGD